MIRWPRALLLLVLLAPAAAAVDADLRHVFEEANRRFAAATEPREFLEVAALYRSLVERGLTSGAVLFNLGNAYMRAGETGRALAAYRQAERYRPRDPLLASNRELAEARLAVAPPPATLLDHVLFWRGWLSYPEQAQGVLLLATLAFLLGLAGLWFGRAWRAAAASMLLLTALLGTTFVLTAQDVATVHGVVVADRTVARKGNAESFAPAFTEPLREGTEFVVQERRDGWVRAAVGSGLEGWLRVDDVVLY